jgi:hypothetical protein
MGGGGVVSVCLPVSIFHPRNFNALHFGDAGSKLKIVEQMSFLSIPAIKSNYIRFFKFGSLWKQKVRMMHVSLRLFMFY